MKSYREELWFETKTSSTPLSISQQHHLHDVSNRIRNNDEDDVVEK